MAVQLKGLGLLQAFEESAGGLDPVFNDFAMIRTVTYSICVLVFSHHRGDADESMSTIV